ncbi:hypothetical protein J6590_024418 [Homalodisca vitripennis]|nr:hypothetical protein J6590_024418 [Homalodisca vitripennis]
MAHSTITQLIASCTCPMAFLNQGVPTKSLTNAGKCSILHLAQREFVQNLGEKEVSVTLGSERLYRSRSLLTDSVKLKLKQSLALSVFQYCYAACSKSISSEDVQRIQKVQNAAIRFWFRPVRRRLNM